MLLDHFHGELARRRDWHGFHQTWAIMLAADLNRRLPDGWFAEPNVQFHVEIDVAALESHSTETGHEQAVSRVEGQDLALDWSPAPPTAVLEVPAWNDTVAVEIYSPESPRHLAGAIELVSPSNKDRPDSRERFVAKCERYLQTGVGLIVVDVVTDRHADLHGLLLERMDPASSQQSEPSGHGCDELFACSYQPVIRQGSLRLEMWLTEFVVGKPLPTTPLFLENGPVLPVDLNASYLESCELLRLPNSYNCLAELIGPSC